jgi:hypothetical protein
MSPLSFSRRLKFGDGLLSSNRSEVGVRVRLIDYLLYAQGPGFQVG